MRRAAGLASRRVERLARHERRLDGRGSRLAGIRLLLGAGLLVAAGIAWRMPALREQALVAVALLLAAFVGVVALHSRVRRRHRLASGVLEAARRDLLRSEGTWRSLPRMGEGLAAPGREMDIAADLSLLGQGSLFQLVSRCATPWGERRLAGLFLAASPAADLLERQAAVSELSRRGSFRRRLEAEGLGAGRSLAGAEALAAQLARTSWLEGRGWVAPLGLALASVTIGLGLLGLGWGEWRLFWPSVLVNVIVSAWLSRHLLPEYEELIDREEPVLACAGMLRLLETRGGRSAMARRWRVVAAEPSSSSRALRDLGSILSSLALRRNAFWWPMQAFTMWDAWQVARLARWRRAHGGRLAILLETLADAEACSSLGGHAEISGGTFARVAEDQPAFLAEGLGHPLLPPGKSVPNDVELGDSARVLLLTGSNMSGKSTLLRAVGLNAILALAGGACVARSLSMRPCRVLSSIRVTDALDEGVSLFYAEVRRLKTVIEAAAEAARGDGLPVLFLVDEILRGTNTRERHAAARAIVARLALSGSAGIVTSHDIELTALEGQAPGIRNGHFREEVRDGLMTFDHLLRPGPVTTSNALAILRLEGIEVE